MISRQEIIFKLKHLVAALIILVIAISILYWVDTWTTDMKDKHSVAGSVINHIAGAMIIAAIWHSINEFFLRKEFLAEIKELLSPLESELFVSKSEIENRISNLKTELSKEIGSARKDTKLGLVDTLHDVAGYSYSDFIMHPRELTIVIRDGYSWVSMNIEALRARLSDPAKKTKVFLTHPDSEMVDIIAKRINLDPASYKSRIVQTVRVLAAEVVKDTDLVIFGHFGITHHALYLGDRLAVTPYYLSRKKKNPPLFIFQGGTFVSQIQKDINELELESMELYNSRSEACRSEMDD